MQLTTRRTTLRPLTRADIEVMHALWTDPFVRQYLWDNVIIARERAAEVIAASEADFASRRYGLCAVIDNASGEIAGFCGFRTSDDDEPELLYGFWPRYWGRGL